jgi:hypothetical protein
VHPAACIERRSGAYIGAVSLRRDGHPAQRARVME